MEMWCVHLFSNAKIHISIVQLLIVLILCVYIICFMIRFVVHHALQWLLMNSIYYHAICLYIVRDLLFSLTPHNGILSNIYCIAVESLTASGQEVSATKKGGYSLMPT